MQGNANYDVIVNLRARAASAHDRGCGIVLSVVIAYLDLAIVMDLELEGLLRLLCESLEPIEASATVDTLIKITQ